MSLFGLTTVGIIGSAGRKADAKKMKKAIFEGMISKMEAVIVNNFKLELSKVHLISGGAAWADHVAVMQYLDEKVPKLTLHLPTKWHRDDNDPKFHDNLNSDIYKNPGRSANKLHKQFSAKIGEDSLKHIQSACLVGAKFQVHDGFKARNTAVATGSRYLIAFTWNDGDTPKKESGTFDTWKKHTGKKIHIPIGSLPEAKLAAKSTVYVPSPMSSGKDPDAGESALEGCSEYVCVDSGFSSQSSSLQSCSSGERLSDCVESRSCDEAHRLSCVKRGGDSLDSVGDLITSPKRKKL